MAASRLNVRGAMVKKRIGILTGGGDVPGLNSVIKTVTYRSSENYIEVVGLRRGWEALTHLNLDDAESRRRYVMMLDRESTRTIDRRGGTVLHSSRTNPTKMQKLPDHLAGKDFPFSQSIKGVTTNTWDVSKRAMLDGKTGLISALVNGRYELVPIPDPELGPRKVDVATMYNTERYRPMYANKRGLSVFLQRAS
jgi:hypothetical protein